MIPEVIEHPSPAQILEVVTRAVFQAGVKWSQIADRWGAYREAFTQFDVAAVAAFDTLDTERVLACDGIGPLYNPTSERSMGEAISWVAEALDMPPLENGRSALRAPNA